MKSLSLSLVALAFGTTQLFTAVKESFDDYKLDAVCIKEHVALGYERKDITAKQCPNNSLVLGKTAAARN